MNSTEESGTRIQALGGAITGVGATLTKGLTVPLVTAGTASLTVAANFQEGMSKYFGHLGRNVFEKNIR